MSTLVLVALVGGAFAWQLLADRAELRRLAAGRGWTELRVVWSPLGELLRTTRWERAYRIAYRDEQGRPARRHCKVSGFFVAELADLGPVAGEGAPGASLSRAASALPRPALVLLGAGLGAFAGVALGILACFVIFPGSNIAPAYGVILGGPLGLAAGAVAGLVWRRSGARAR